MTVIFNKRFSSLLESGSLGWALPMDPTVRGIHMGDITELGTIVAGAFAKPNEAGNGTYLPLVGDLMSFNEIVDIFNQQGHAFSFTHVPTEIFVTLFEGADEIAATFSYFQTHTYLGSNEVNEYTLSTIFKEQNGNN